MNVRFMNLVWLQNNRMKYRYGKNGKRIKNKHKNRQYIDQQTKILVREFGNVT